ALRKAKSSATSTPSASVASPPKSTSPSTPSSPHPMEACMTSDSELSLAPLMRLSQQQLTNSWTRVLSKIVSEASLAGALRSEVEFIQWLRGNGNGLTLQETIFARTLYRFLIDSHSRLHYNLSNCLLSMPID